MRLGLLSDSHGHGAITARAVRLLIEQGADCLVHLGDVENMAVIDALAGHPAHLVFGNCDWDIDGLTRYARDLEISVDHPEGRIEADGKVVSYTHGHLSHLMEGALRDGVDYLLHGHTHELADRRVGRTRVINPGALFRASSYTVATLDLPTDELCVLEVGRKALR